MFWVRRALKSLGKPVNMAAIALLILGVVVVVTTDLQWPWLIYVAVAALFLGPTVRLVRDLIEIKHSETPREDLREYAIDWVLEHSSIVVFMTSMIVFYILIVQLDLSRGKELAARLASLLLSFGLSVLFERLLWNTLGRR